MSSRNASRLEPGLIARKGEAVPAASPSTSVPVLAASAQIGPGSEARASVAAPPPSRGLHGTIAVTVRLDPYRYERLKVHGARLRRTNQEILVEALDRYFQGVAE